MRSTHQLRHMSSRLKRWPSAIAVVAILAVSCRDGVPPFTVPEFEYAERITFGTGEDRDPQWVPGTDSLIYHTNSFAGMPNAGVLLQLPADGGTATPVFESVQRTNARTFA